MLEKASRWRFPELLAALWVIGLSACGGPTAGDQHPPRVPEARARLLVNGLDRWTTLVVDGRDRFEEQRVPPATLRAFHVAPGEHTLELTGGGEPVERQTAVLAGGRTYVFDPGGRDQYAVGTYRYQTGHPPKSKLVIVLGQLNSPLLEKGPGPYSWLHPEPGANWRYAWAKLESERAVRGPFFEVEAQLGPLDVLPEDLFAPPADKPAVTRLAKRLPEAPDSHQLACALRGGEYGEEDVERAREMVARRPASELGEVVRYLVQTAAGDEARKLVHRRFDELAVAELLAEIRALDDAALGAAAREWARSRVEILREHHADRAKNDADRKRLRGILENEANGAAQVAAREWSESLQTALRVAAKKADTALLAAYYPELLPEQRALFAEAVRGLLFPKRLALVKAITARDHGELAADLYPLLHGPGGFAGDAFADPELGPQLLTLPGIGVKGHALYGDYVDFLGKECEVALPDQRARLAQVLPALPAPGTVGGCLIARYGESGLQEYERLLGHRPAREERKKLVFPPGPPFCGMSDWYLWLIREGERSERSSAFKDIFEQNFAGGAKVRESLAAAAAVETDASLKKYMQKVLGGVDVPRLRWKQACRS
ncbi:MAG: hypothetical protein HYV63_10925 [Candidatus Schekmanbacteria bacterium]|nr:hypothetical protein [Candidatus Schekmanbacteria bacterium]